MPSRYDNNLKKKLNDGRTVYRTKRYPAIPKLDSDIYIITQGGDRLDSIANHYYNDSSLWWIIASANNIHDPSFSVPEGTQLRVPTDYFKIVNEFNN
jgi:hypothetical protein